LSKADAERWSRGIELDMDRGTFTCRSEAERTTLNELLDRYLVEITPTKKGADAESYLIKKWKRHPMSRKMISSVRASDLAKFRDESLKTMSANSVRNELALLSGLFEIARKEWGYGVSNPVRDIRKPSPPAGRERRFVAGEEEALLAECDRSRAWYLGAVVRLALETAARMGELANLRWNDVDLPRQTAYFRDTKNGENRRIPLSTAAIRILKQLPRSVDGRVFPVSKASIKSSFHDAVVRVRREYVHQGGANEDYMVDLHFHDLRHEAVSRLFELGLNSMEVAGISGHKTLQMLKRYTHLKAEDLARKLG
jgi:integrase